ncbi:transmembrane protein 245-like isoform X2 [Babylonia areolata]|uniref:transmembrane protein 245-like isoform X2 n=1 Tax=Babylonia areolata TaxID=304850 RepID=UPI003FD23EB2
MASPSLEYLNNVWQYVPQGHEKALKQAFYNTAANIFLVLAAAAVVAVYFVFSPFIRPLCWALLCGTFLYPFKRTLTDALRGWLKGLSSSGTPFFVGLVILPVQVVASTTDALSDAIWNHVAVILAVMAGLPLLHLLYHFGPLYTLAQGLMSVLDFLYNFLDYFSAFWVYTLVIAYVIVVAAYWRPESRRMLSRLAIPVWVSVVLHVASAAGPLRVPLLIVLVTMMVVGFMAEIKQASQKEAAEGGEPTGSPTVSAARALFGWRSSENEQEVKGEESSEGDSGTGTAKLEKGPVLKPASTPASSATSVTSTASASGVTGSASTTTSTTKPTSLGVKGQSEGGGEEKKTGGEQETSFSVRCFQALLWAHVLVRLWMHLWLILILLLLPLINLGLKRLGGMRLVREVWLRINEKVGSWLTARRDALAPRSVRGIGKLLMRGDRKLIGVLESSLDSATSTLMILALLIGTFIFSIIGFVQIQRESMYIVTVSSNIFNNTVNQDLSQWLPDAPAMQDTMDSMVGKAYTYGRTFITTKVRELLSGDEHANVTQVETQVLEVWDQVYDKWFSKNATSKAPALSMPEVGDVWALWDMMSHGQLLNTSKITAFAQENVGTFVSVLESVWSVIRSNMTLVLSILTSTLSIVFGGGTAILNFVVSAAIFLTTLFYLLAFSGSQYKPVEFFTAMSPSLGSLTTPPASGSASSSSTGSRFGQAVEQAISGVFMASLKMSAFYGLWTWLVHLVFGLDIVFIPSALAAVFAAIPFVGAYWACIPGVVDLWLVQGQGLAAIGCLLAHMAPAYVVDTAIYSEIKEGHPFLTGLAIAGGMYCMGLEGAILGPILLCCLIVLINMYGSMLRSDTPTSDVHLWSCYESGVRMKSSHKSDSMHGTYAVKRHH